jgi:hypothetical protein
MPSAGSARARCSGGLALVAAGAALLALAPDRPAYAADLLPGYLALGLGMGLAFPAVSITAMSEVAHETAGVASGLISTAHEVGAALGVAALSAVAFATAGTVDYGSASLVAALAAAALAVLAAVVMPAVRPAPGVAVPVH